MRATVLLVDDEPNVLQGYVRALRRDFALETADGGAAALALLDAEHEFAVVVSDMRMPGMDGLELLRAIKQRSPDTVRVMLTGNTDQPTAVAAINEGDVFRFLTKPCDPAVFAKTLRDALDQHHLLRAEKELLEGTLAGAVGALSETLGLVNAEAFGRVDRMKALLAMLAPAAAYGPPWKVEVLATLSQLGCVILPDGALRKLSRGQRLSEEERRLYEMHPSIGCNMIEKIPRLGDVAEAVRYQLKHYDGGGVPHDKLTGAQIPLGARLLKLVNDFISAESAGQDPSACIATLRAAEGEHDPVLLQALCDALGVTAASRSVRLSISMLSAGMVLAKDICKRDGQLLLGAGQKLSDTGCKRLLALLTEQAIDDGIDVVIEAA